MCGIFGILAKAGTVPPKRVRQATDTLKHRGPDSTDINCVFRSKDWELWFGHTRLAILDLSHAADQPYTSPNASLVFNGEIYNYIELASALGSSEKGDTAVLFQALRERGKLAVNDLVGMFAFAHWENDSQTLLLARDRLGQKPLFFRQTSDTFIFASEPRAIISYLDDAPPISESDLRHFQWMGYVPKGRSGFDLIEQLLPATQIELTLTGRSFRRRDSCYWDPLESMAQVRPGTYEDHVHELDELLRDAMRLRLRSDVAMGLYVSAGVDSQLTGAFAAELGAEVTAFIAKVDDPRFDESHEALSVAKSLFAEVEVVPLNEDAVERQMQRVKFSIDQPLADLSLLPMMALSEVASQQVKVVLTGDGGDEPFLGYPWNTFPDSWSSKLECLNYIPNILSQIGRSSVTTPLGLNLLRRLLELTGKDKNSATELALLLAAILKDHDANRIHDALKAQSPLSRPSQATLVDEARLAHPDWSWENWGSSNRSPAERFAFIELTTFLSELVLAKTDRATMSYGLEARSPFLDHRVVEFGISLPASSKNKKLPKRILRDLLARKLGLDSVPRPKTGFGMPVPSGLRIIGTESQTWNAYILSVFLEKYSSPK